MTHNLFKFDFAIPTNNTFNHSKTLRSWFIALFAGCQLGAGALAASQDSLRPSPPVPSVLDPQSEKDTTGLNINQKKTTVQESPQSGKEISFRVKNIKLVGNKIFSTDELLAAAQGDNTVASFNGKMTFDQLKTMAGKITAYYQDRGYLVGQAVIPQQDVTDGIVTIHVIEGRIDHVSADPKAWNKDNRLVTEFQRIYDDTQIINDKLSGTMARIGEATGTVGRINLQPSSKVGGSDVVLYTNPLPSFFYGFTTDNFGSKSTSVYRGNTFVGGYSWLTDGDSTRFEFGATDQFERSRRYDLTYSTPFGFSGWTGSARAWKTEYNLGGTFANTRATGEAQAAEAAVSYALLRASAARADWKTGYSFVSLSDKVAATTNANRERHTQTVWTGVSGYFEDTLLKNRARTIYTSSLTGGQLDFDDAAAKAADATGRKTKGMFGFVSA